MKLLTLFIPSYNRAPKLEAALASIRAAIDQAGARDDVEVLVVDDYSTEDIPAVIARRRAQGDQLTFRQHTHRCGVAEIAMLACLEHVTTRYAWCVGNDDRLLPHALEYLLPLLDGSRVGFHVLNLFGARGGRPAYEYFSSAEPVLHFDKGSTFFDNFGFVTATTTFPCLLFEVAPVRKLDLASFTGRSPIYSHTAAFFQAFHQRPCAFVPRPVVYFNHNESAEEHAKLSDKNRRRRRPDYFHATAGLARHLLAVSSATGVPLSRLAGAREDEMDKESFQVKRTMTGFFILTFAIQQLRFELEAVPRPGPRAMHLTLDDVEDLARFFAGAERPDLGEIWARARTIYSDWSLPAWRRSEALVGLQVEGFDLERCAVDAQIAQRAPLGYAVYGQGSGVKVTLDPDRPAPDRPSLCFEGSPDLGDEAFELRCLPSRVKPGALATLEAMAATTTADVIVFNNLTDTETFARLFAPQASRRQKGTPAERSVWRRTDLKAGALGRLLAGGHGDFAVGSMHRRRREASRAREGTNPVVEFINWRPLA